jgi:OST-HTH/LOTUS domain
LWLSSDQLATAASDHVGRPHRGELAADPAKGDPQVSLPEHGDREEAFGLLRSMVHDLTSDDGAVALSGLKNQLRRVRADFSGKKLGYRSFLQFCKAAATSGAVQLRWSPEAGAAG